jgi:hypothetical protein
MVILLLDIGAYYINGYIGGYWWLLVAIGCYHINDYWCYSINGHYSLFYWWLLVVILLMIINGYFIND